MKEDVKKRYQDKNAKCIINTASLLDPRFKLLSFLYPDDKEAAHKNLEAKVLQIEDQKVKIQLIKVEKLTGDCAPSLPTLSDGNEISASAATAVKTEVVSPTSSPDPKRKRLMQDNFFDEFLGDLIVTKVEKSPVVVERFKEELIMYLSMEPIVSSAKVLDWWKMNEKQFPLLANAAKQLLCTPATSTPSERAFSKAQILISDERALLKPANVDKVLFLNRNYFQFK